MQIADDISQSILSQDSELTIDVSGDGGVTKVVKQQGSGNIPLPGSVVEVHYVGTLRQNGLKFDSSRDLGKPFKFSLGEGKVIKAWEYAVASMSIGEKCIMTCTSAYAYGIRGVPPIIPSNATLDFEMELMSFSGGLAVRQSADPAIVALKQDSLKQKSALDIQNEYEAKMADKAVPLEGMEAVKNWFSKIYIFGLFDGPKGKRPPWYLNPNLTFPALFVFVFLTFYFILEVGGVHGGTPVIDEYS